MAGVCSKHREAVEGCEACHSTPADVSLDLRLACNRWVRGSAALEEAPARQAENEMWWREKKYRSVA